MKQARELEFPKQEQNQQGSSKHVSVEAVNNEKETNVSCP